MKVPRSLPRLAAALLAVFACAVLSVPAAPAAAAEAKPAVKRSPAQEKLIRQVIAAAGLPEQMDEMQKSIDESFKSGMAQALQRRGEKPSPEAQARARRMGEAISGAFRARDFLDRIAAEFADGYDEARLRAALADLGRPLIRRMTEVEKAPVEPAALAAYAARLRGAPLAPERIASLERIDNAAGASELGARMAITTAKAMIYAAPGMDAQRAGAAAADIDAHRRDIFNRVRAQMGLQFAYTYRDVNDADLAAYAAAVEGENLAWLNRKIAAALGLQFETGALRMADAFHTIMQPGNVAAPT